MKRVKPRNVVSWYAKCRAEVNKLPTALATMTLEEKLAHIRQQYVVLSQIDKFFRGDAYFIGYPKLNLPTDVNENSE